MGRGIMSVEDCVIRPNCFSTSVAPLIGLAALSAIVFSIIGLVAPKNSAFAPIVNFGAKNHKILLSIAAPLFVIDLFWLRTICINGAKERIREKAAQLEKAAENGNISLVNQLLSQKLSTKDKDSAAKAAAKNGHLPVITALNNSGISDDGRIDALLVIAWSDKIEENHISIIGTLAKQIRSATRLSWKDTVLLAAFKKAHFEIIKLLLTQEHPRALSSMKFAAIRLCKNNTNHPDPAFYLSVIALLEQNESLVKVSRDLQLMIAAKNGSLVSPLNIYRIEQETFLSWTETCLEKLKANNPTLYTDTHEQVQKLASSIAFLKSLKYKERVSHSEEKTGVPVFGQTV